MDETDLRRLLAAVGSGELTPEAASAHLLDVLRAAPFEDVGFARIDHHRPIRQGFPEVVFGQGKTPAQIAVIAQRIAARGDTLIVTRTTSDAHAAVEAVLPDAVWHEVARVITRPGRVPPAPGHGPVLVASAGTSDLPVAEEAAVTAETMGNAVERVYDVGVAGLHRLLSERARLARARVVVVVADMEGALPSVIGGLVAVPVIAVPTSVGYGASFHGLSALLGMLNTCAPGVAVVNIDNGFGAATIASRINHL